MELNAEEEEEGRKEGEEDNKATRHKKMKKKKDKTHSSCNIRSKVGLLLTFYGIMILERHSSSD